MKNPSHPVEDVRRVGGVCLKRYSAPSGAAAVEGLRILDEFWTE